MKTIKKNIEETIKTNIIPFESECKIYMGLLDYTGKAKSLYTIAEFKSIEWGTRFWDRIKKEIELKMWEDCVFIFEDLRNKKTLQIYC